MKYAVYDACCNFRRITALMLFHEKYIFDIHDLFWFDFMPPEKANLTCTAFIGLKFALSNYRVHVYICLDAVVNVNELIAV